MRLGQQATSTDIHIKQESLQGNVASACHAFIALSSVIGHAAIGLVIRPKILPKRTFMV